MQIDLVRTSPRPVLLIKCPKSGRKAAANEVFNRLLKMGLLANFSRGFDIDRLSYILANGCDVSPTNSPMFVADGMDKAVEYGGLNQVIQVFDLHAIKRTWTEISSEEEREKIEALKKKYTSWEVSADGSHIWYSMFPFDERRRTTPYEAAYGWYIPGNAWEALMALAIFVDTDAGTETTLSLLKSCKDPIWS